MIRQIYYTSCRHGRDGIQGFQVAAATPGVARRHEDLVLPVAAYRPPRSASPIPDAEEVAALPVALGYKDFGDVVALFRSSYLGDDYTGRQGNYFAHVLLAEDPAELPGQPPAAAWDAAWWFRGPWDDRPGATDLPAPEPLACGPLATGGAVPEWLAREPDAFARLLHLVREALAGRVAKVVVVADGPSPDARVASAILAVTAPLPEALARRVSFTTFSAAPADPELLVVGTTPDAPLPPARDTAVLVLGEGESREVSPFAALAAARLGAGPGGASGLRALAAEAVPAPGPDDLDALAAAARLLDADPGGDVLVGLEFVADRLPGRVDANLWSTVDAALAAGATRPADDVARWSAVLGRTGGHSPLLRAAYLNAVLIGVAEGADGTDLWLPGPDDDGVDVDGGGWIGVAVTHNPRPRVVAAVLATLRRLGVDASDAELDEVVDRVLLPVVLDPHGDVAAVRDLPDAARLAAATVARLEGRLADDLIETAVQDMSVDAARWLASSAPAGTRCALVTAVRLVRAGELDPVAVMAGARDSAELDRLAALVWSGPPPAEAGTRLIAALDPAVLAGSAVPASLAERLVLDARERATGPAQVGLTTALAGLGDGLRGPARDQIEAVRLTELFRARPPSDPSTRQSAIDAVACRADPVLSGPLVRVLVQWLFSCREALTHADLLEAAYASGASEFLAHYDQQLARTLHAADAEDVVAVLPAVIHLSANHQGAADLLEGTCATQLGRRRRRTLDEVGHLLSEAGNVPPDLRPGRAASWTAWWKSYRARELSGSGLRERLLRFGRDG
ncbi:hypothetical protein [Pseudonocardia lacus]|uniref:GAP1-N2 domain-containing protein n=1 Tax=Pseudonocardia lacus TaxID=2835865 RepID=UPI001BDBE094|nr:hypothetical protein [Pseudonocardia lacus]